MLRDKYKEQARQLMDDGLVKSIEFEYACRFLQSLNMEANQTNINAILQRHPLSKCEIQTQGWDNLADMVDLIMIYPYRDGRKTKNFHNYLKEKLFGRRNAQDEESNDEDQKPSNEPPFQWNALVNKIGHQHEHHVNTYKNEIYNNLKIHPDFTAKIKDFSDIE